MEKQARGHTVFVGPELDRLLTMCTVDARTELVFPLPRTGGRISGWTRLVAAAAERSGVSFGLHDLRRTFRTGLSRLGIERDIAELALGHARADLEGRYNRDDCAQALRSAFVRWGSHVGRFDL